MEKSLESNLILDGTKLPWHLDRVKDWMNGDRVVPLTVEYALTRRCTYDCMYDNYDYKERKNFKDIITKEIAFNLLEDAAELGVKATPIGCDGESTCSPLLYEVIPYAKKLGLDTALSTNGFLLKDDRLEEILSYMTYLRFNISAGEPHRYAEVMGVGEKCFDKVCNTIKKCSEIKKRDRLDVTLGLQMVCMPEFGDQVMPLARLGKELGVDYLVIKHCSDDHRQSLGIDYSKYDELIPVFKEAESLSDETYLVIPKWSKILSEGKTKYSHCFGPQFLIQISASGLVAPCGNFFHDKYKKFHIGDITKTRFRDIVKSDKYYEVMNHIGSNKFNNTNCWSLCFQHKLNEFLWDLNKGYITLEDVEASIKNKEPPQHINFV